MNEQEAKELLNTLKDEYQLYPTSKNNEIPAWAYYVNDAMDKEESIRNGKRLFHFEIFTDSQINYILRNIQSPEFISASCTFTAILSLKEDEELISGIKNNFKAHDYTRVTLKSSSAPSLDGKLHIPGKLEVAFSLPSKYRNENLLNYQDITMICNRGISDCEAISRLKDIVANIRENKYSFEPPTEKPDDDEAGPIAWPIDVRIYNVGGANAALARYPNNKSLLIDCGCDRYIPIHYARTIKHIMDKVVPSAIFISHWHVDHYSLFPYIQKDKLEYIILPDYATIPPCLAMEVYNLEKKQGVTVIDLSRQKKYDLSTLGYAKTIIFAGEGNVPKDPRLGIISYDNKPNDSAYIVTIGNQYRRIIFPSDVSYFNWPDAPELKIESYNRFVVPHHGGNVYTAPVPTPNKINSGKIYVSSYFKPLKNIQQTYHYTYLHDLMTFSNPPDLYYTRDKDNPKMRCYYGYKL